MLAANVVAGECRRSLSSDVVLQSGHTFAAMSLICKDGATPRRILVVSKVGCPLIPPVSYSSSTIDVSHKGDCEGILGTKVWMRRHLGGGIVKE